MDTVRDLGVEVRLGAKVDHVDFETNEVHLQKGGVVMSDVMIGADGTYAR